MFNSMEYGSGLRAITEWRDVVMVVIYEWSLIAPIKKGQV